MLSYRKTQQHCCSLSLDSCLSLKRYCFAHFSDHLFCCRLRRSPFGLLWTYVYVMSQCARPTAAARVGLSWWWSVMERRKSPLATTGYSGESWTVERPLLLVVTECNPWTPQSPIQCKQKAKVEELPVAFDWTRRFFTFGNRDREGSGKLFVD